MNFPKSLYWYRFQLMMAGFETSQLIGQPIFIAPQNPFMALPRLLLVYLIATQTILFSQEVKGIIKSVYDGDTFVFANGEQTSVDFVGLKNALL